MAAFPNDADARIAPADKRAGAMSDEEFREFARQRARRSAASAPSPIATSTESKNIKPAQSAAAVNPYAAPSARVEDSETDRDDDGDFALEGVAVPARNGVEWFTGAIAMFKDKPQQWLAIMFVFAVINTIASVHPMLGAVFFLFLYLAFYGGLMIAVHRHATEDTLGIGDLFAGFQRAPGKLIGAAFVTFLVLVGGTIIAVVTGGLGLFALLSGGGGGGPSIGAMFLAIPIMIVTAFIYCAVIWFTPALIALEDVGITDAIRASFKVSMRNFGAMALYGLLTIVYLIACAIVVGLVFAMLGRVGEFLATLLLTMAMAIPVISTYRAFRDIFYTR
jgi:hypothetical protein